MFNHMKTVEPGDKWPRNAYETEGVHFYSVMQLLVMKQPSFWEANKQQFLRRLIGCVHVRHHYPTGSQLPATVPTILKDYSVYKPALLFFTMVDTCVKLFKKHSIANCKFHSKPSIATFLITPR